MNDVKCGSEDGWVVQGGNGFLGCVYRPSGVFFFFLGRWCVDGFYHLRRIEGNFGGLRAPLTEE